MKKNIAYLISILALLALGSWIGLVLYFESIRIPDEGEGYMQQSKQKDKGYMVK